jgi:hypothetical protein
MFALPPLDPGFEIVVSSHGMSKGISQSDGPQFIPKLFVERSGVQAGAQWKNVSQSGAKGEFAAFLNATHRFRALQLTGGATYKISTATRPGWDSRSLELNAAAVQKVGKKLSFKLSGIYSPNDIGPSGKSLYVEGGASFDASKTFRVSANVGSRQREGSPDYTSFNAGVTKTLFKRLGVDARYYRTDRDNLGYTYRDRIVVSARLAI